MTRGETQFLFGDSHLENVGHDRIYSVLRRTVRRPAGRTIAPAEMADPYVPQRDAGWHDVRFQAGALDRELPQEAICTRESFRPEQSCWCRCSSVPSPPLPNG